MNYGIDARQCLDQAGGSDQIYAYAGYRVGVSPGGHASTEGNDLVACFDTRFDDIPADEAGPTCDENFQDRCSILPRRTGPAQMVDSERRIWKTIAVDGRWPNW